MTAEGLQIFRLVIAGVNGLLFFAGIYYLLEIVVKRPKRWKKRLAWLMLQADKEELEHNSLKNKQPFKSEHRLEIEKLRKKLKTNLRDPESLLSAGMGALMIIVALFALMNLLFPAFYIFK